MTRIENSPPPRRLTLMPLTQAQGTVPDGSLIISDVFTSSQESHGVSVAKAAHDLGFQGPVFYQQASTQPVPALQKSTQAAQLLKGSLLKPDMVEEALHLFTVGPALHMLSTGTEEVQRANASEAKHSVLNLSSGVCKAQVTSMLYQQAASSWSSEPQAVSVSPENDLTSENLANLYGLNHNALCHQNPIVSGLERQKLQQKLIDTVDQAWNNEPLIAEHKNYLMKAVEVFEAKNNSVVIAAGNEGLVKPALEMQSGGSLRTPEDFEENVLDSPLVTSVGATIIIDGEEAPARYSSTWAGVDLYASGDRVIGREFKDGQGLNGAGTSIAAPRVGAIMAKLHGDNPEMSSLEVENTLSREFTQDQAGILFSGVAEDFLREA